MRFCQIKDVYMVSLYQLPSFLHIYSQLDQTWKHVSFLNENSINNNEEERDSIFEWFYRRRPRTVPESPDKPPPPPSRIPNFFQRVFNAILAEGTFMTKEIVSGSAASVVSVFATHPLDVLKLEYMALAQKKTPNEKFFSMGRQFYFEIRNIYRTHGISKFYNGHGAAQRESVFQTVSMFYTHQRVYQTLEDEGLGQYPNFCSFVSGFLSATIAVVGLKPIAEHRDQQIRKRDLLKRYGPIQCAYELRQPEKLSDLFRGCFPEFMYLGTQYGLRFWIYNEIRDFLIDRKMKASKINTISSDKKEEPTSKHLTYGESLFAGAVSGIVADLASHPLDVVSSRLHMGTLQRQHYHYDDTCRHYIQCLRLVWKKSSIRGLYAGLTPGMIKSMISVALQFAVYGRFEELLDQFF